MPEHAELISVGSGRAALTGVALPSPPPARIYLSGFEYKIQAPRVPLPPIANVVKAILNWIGPGFRVAKNVLYLKQGSGGTASTSDPTTLQQLADMMLTGMGATALSTSWSSGWTLQSITCRDAGGTSARGDSTGSAIPGNVTGGSQPPQCALCISWNIAESYRGGKPRTYVPGVPFTAVSPSGSSTLDPTFCTNADTSWTAWKNYINTHPILSTPFTLGTVSYHTAHAVRPTPLFRTYTAVKVHERLDSQRRRSGPESAFAVTPAVAAEEEGNSSSADALPPTDTTGPPAA